MSSADNIGKHNLKKRNERVGLIYLLSFLSGFVLLGLAEARERSIIESPVPIIISMLLVFLFVSYLNWLWYDGMDEYEKETLGKACFWGMSVGGIILPWFLLNELSIIASEPNALVIVGLMYATFTIYYYYKKFSNR